MNIPDIDFTRMRPLGPGGQRAGFEQFICEQAARETPGPGAKFVSLHGDGGDGGVECYWTLPSGEEHGHQAKYWTHHSEVNKIQLDKSVKAAIKQHPNLTKYTIAIPTDPTGRTGGRGKSLLEKIHDPGGWLEGWQQVTIDSGMTVQIEIEWATNIVDRLNRLDASGVERRYWFDAEVLSLQWWHDRYLDAEAAARPRYVPQLNIEVPAAQSIAALCSDDEWWKVVLDQAENVTEAIRHLGYGDKAVLAADLDAARGAANTVIDVIVAWQASRSADGLENVTKALEDAIATVAAGDAAETAAMDAAHDNWDNQSWRQWNAEYMGRFPAAPVDALRGLLTTLNGVAELLVSPLGKLAGSKVAFMTGPAGVGKTYLAIDAVAHRLAKGRPSVMLHGRWFNNSDPLTHLRDVLKMPSDLTSEDAIALLDESGRTSGFPTLLIIDALNETRPKSAWRDNLDRLVATIGRYPNVRLLLTARTHYVSQVLPRDLTLTRFEHTGFEGVEFEAVSEYAAHYGLEPPTSPPVHGEFDNPLYLRLVCEALKANSQLSLDHANMGLDELTKMVLDNANAIISDHIDAPPSDQVVHQAMHSLAAAIAGGAGAPLARSGAQAVLTPIWSDRSAEKSLLDELIAQGLVEEDVLPDASTFGTDVIAITFERIGHHLVVSDAFKDVTAAEGVRAVLTGDFGAVIGLGEAIDLGLLEATSVVIAERLGLELTEFSAEIGNDDAVDASVIAGTAWRRPGSITIDTGDIITNALRRAPNFEAGLTMMFRLAVRPGHPLSAEFLHGFLMRWNMGARDQFLPGWLHSTHGTSGAVDRLIRWALEKPLDQVSGTTTRLWVTALLWTTSCTDRRVREPATIAAARLLVRQPSQAADLLERFAEVNDEWVIERALNVAYSALLLGGSGADWKAASEVVWKAFFERPADLTPNVAVRDAARSILEAANDRSALPAGIAEAQFRPPYASYWPLDWPTKEDINAYDTTDYPKLVFSSTGDDFFTYKLKHDLRNRPGIDLDAAGRWVVTEAIRLGYRPERHAWFDSYVMDRYGGGRSKPKWIERIGKKYQWIALNRLIGHVSDHAPQTANKWDPPPPAIPGPSTTISRQIDPTVVEFEPANYKPRPWVPEYDWAVVADESDAAWVADDTDLPTIAVTEATRDERPFIVMSGDYDWDEEEGDTRGSRRMWNHLYSHFVNTTDLLTALGELEGKDLTGHHLSNSPETSDGYVGEYPYGYHHGSMRHRIDHESRQALSVPTTPAYWYILGEYEYAGGNYDSVSIDAPAPELFGPAPGNLHWNGRNGWTDTTTGQLVAVLRHTVRASENEFLIDAGWLETWLTEERKSLIWIENTGKDIYVGMGDGDAHPGALIRSQVHWWTPGSPRQTAAPGWQRIPARGE